MVCIYCGGETKVINSRSQRKANQIWRRRRCVACKAVFSTEERAITENSLVVTWKNRVQPFSREKLLLSVYDSLRHRKTALSDATALTATIQQKLQPFVQNASLPHSAITGVVTKVLDRFDKSAAVHYRAYHPDQD